MNQTSDERHWWRRLQDEYIHLSHAFSKDSSRSLQDVLVKTNIFVLFILLQNVFKTCCQNVFNRFSRRLQDVLQKSLQDIFKTFCKDVFNTFSIRIIMLKLSCQHVFEKYSTSFWDVMQRRLSTEGFASVTFLKNLWSVCKIARVIKISQVLVFHFTTPYIGCLQRRI